MASLAGRYLVLPIDMGDNPPIAFFIYGGWIERDIKFDDDALTHMTPSNFWGVDIKSIWLDLKKKQEGENGSR